MSHIHVTSILEIDASQTFTLKYNSYFMRNLVNVKYWNIDIYKELSWYLGYHDNLNCIQCKINKNQPNYTQHNVSMLVRHTTIKYL